MSVLGHLKFVPVHIRRFGERPRDLGVDRDLIRALNGVVYLRLRCDVGGRSGGLGGRFGDGLGGSAVCLERAHAAPIGLAIHNRVEFVLIGCPRRQRIPAFFIDFEVDLGDICGVGIIFPLCQLLSARVIEIHSRLGAVPVGNLDELPDGGVRFVGIRIPAFAPRGKGHAGLGRGPSADVFYVNVAADIRLGNRPGIVRIQIRPAIVFLDSYVIAAHSFNPGNMTVTPCIPPCDCTDGRVHINSNAKTSGCSTPILGVAPSDSSIPVCEVDPISAV